MNNSAYIARRPGNAGRARSGKAGKRIAEKGIDASLDQPLRQVDIVTAIRYYGITELLDHIGPEEIKWYLRYR